MKLAKATPEDFQRFWSIFRAQQRLQYARSAHDVARCKRLILGRLEQLGGGGLLRVVHGCELLIEQCCNPSDDVYALNPHIVRGLELEAREQERIPVVPYPPSDSIATPPAQCPQCAGRLRHGRCVQRGCEWMVSDA